jgi:hypothetical protein
VEKNKAPLGCYNRRGQRYGIERLVDDEYTTGPRARRNKFGGRAPATCGGAAMMNWWRAYHGLPFDSKLALVAKRCDARRGDVAAVWVAVIDFASQHEDRGSVVGIDPEEVALLLDYEIEFVSRILKAFEERGMITAGRLAAWERRQPRRERDDDSTERVRAFRQRQKERTKSRETDETHETDETRFMKHDETHETQRFTSTERVRAFRKRQKEKLLQSETQTAFHVTPGNAQNRAEQNRAEQSRTAAAASETRFSETDGLNGAASPLPEHIERARGLLEAWIDHCKLPCGPPDDNFCIKLLEKAGGIDAFEKKLGALWKAKSRPDKSLGWFLYKL